MPEINRQFSTFQHYQGGVYFKVCEAMHTETEEALVIYVCAVSGVVFARPKSMFEEQVNTPEYTGPRFIPMPASTTRSQRKALRYDPQA